MVQEEERAKQMNKQSRDKLQGSGWKKGFFNTSAPPKAGKGEAAAASKVDEVKEETNPQDSDENPTENEGTLGELTVFDSTTSEQSAKSTETVDSQSSTGKKIKKKVRFSLPEDEPVAPRYRRLISSNIIPSPSSWLKSDSSTSSTSSDEFLDDVRGWKKGFMNLSFKKEGGKKNDALFSVAEHHEEDASLTKETSVDAPTSKSEVPKAFSGYVNERAIPGQLIPGPVKKPKKHKSIFSRASLFGKKSIFSNTRCMDSQANAYQMN